MRTMRARAKSWRDSERPEKAGGAMSTEEDPELRATITAMLAQGLETEVEPFPVTEKEFGEIAQQLRTLPPGDILGRLVIGGFKDHPHGPENWRCADCIYYLANRKWCDLPELALPVEADWYCRLWRM
jgi:hypothetical protein